MKEILKHLRKNQTQIEKIIWKELKNRKFMNLKFRRQYPINNFILDFYCAELKLGIEIDGKIHDKQKEYDSFREDLLKEKNIKIIRATNEEILNDIHILLNKIKSFIS